MDRYLVISAHTAEDCRQAVKYFAEFYAGYITHYEWGCYDNDHHAYAIIEADSHEQAKMTVPPLLRDKTKVIKLTYFYPKKAGEDTVHEKS
ncbi:MAG TPA: hypothetical protein VJY62_10035 [Bacteroidia bacterium]|nr:hypothetical protein [Bacteroidia bacterium]